MWSEVLFKLPRFLLVPFKLDERFESEVRRVFVLAPLSETERVMSLGMALLLRSERGDAKSFEIAPLLEEDSGCGEKSLGRVYISVTIPLSLLSCLCICWRILSSCRPSLVIESWRWSFERLLLLPSVLAELIACPLPACVFCLTPDDLELTDDLFTLCVSYVGILSTTNFTNHWIFSFNLRSTSIKIKLFPNFFWGGGELHKQTTLLTQEEATK